MKPIHEISLPAHHPVVAAMGDNDTAVATVRKVPQPKHPMGEMPRGMTEAERPMPLTHQFHVIDIQAAKGGSKKRPGGENEKGEKKRNPMEYMKERQTKEAYEGGTKPVS